eukprot:364273-Chlamydomonas_euryale.AAC.3
MFTAYKSLKNVKCLIKAAHKRLRDNDSSYLCDLKVSKSKCKGLMANDFEVVKETQRKHLKGELSNPKWAEMILAVHILAARPDNFEYFFLDLKPNVLQQVVRKGVLDTFNFDQILAIVMRWSNNVGCRIERSATTYPPLLGADMEKLAHMAARLLNEDEFSELSDILGPMGLNPKDIRFIHKKNYKHHLKTSLRDIREIEFHYEIDFMDNDAKKTHAPILVAMSLLMANVDGGTDYAKGSGGQAVRERFAIFGLEPPGTNLINYLSFQEIYTLAKQWSINAKI